MPVSLSLKPSADNVRLHVAMRKAGAAWPHVARDLAHNLAMLMEREVEEGLVRNKLVFNGTLSQHIASTVLSDGDAADGVSRGVAYTDTAHGETIDLGRRPGSKRPPVDALIPWVAEKIGDFHRFVKQSGVARKYKSEKRQAKADAKAREVRAVAFVIARSIGKKGMIARFGYSGSHVFGNALKAAKEATPQLARRLIDSFLRDAKS